MPTTKDNKHRTPCGELEAQNVSTLVSKSQPAPGTCPTSRDMKNINIGLQIGNLPFNCSTAVVLKELGPPPVKR